MAIKDAGRKRVQRELTIIIHDRVTRVRSALKTDDDIRLRGEHICDLALSLIAPVCTNNCLNHIILHNLLEL